MTTAPPDVPPPDTSAPEILDAPREMPAEPPAPLAVWEGRLGHAIPSPDEIRSSAADWSIFDPSRAPSTGERT